MAKNFRLLLLLVTTLMMTHTTSGVFWNNLRVKYSINAFNGFHQVPRTLASAGEFGFQATDPSSCMTETDSGTFHGIRATNFEIDPLLSLLFDNNGIIAGVQAWLPHADMLSPENRFHYHKVPMFQNGTMDNRPHFVLTAYFIPPETICNSTRTEESLLTEGTGTGLWLQKGADPLLDSVQISRHRPEVIEAGWTKNNCWPGMGYHNFYRVEDMTSHQCLEDEAAFLLFDKEDEMLGFGFTAHGLANSTHWIEYRQNIVSSVILDPVPQCLLDENTLVGTTAMHVYFNDNPWLFNCL